MGTGKKEKTRREKQGKPRDGMSNVRTKGENFYRWETLVTMVLETALLTRLQVGEESQDLEHVQKW